MTKQQAATYARLLRTCEQLGISREDFESLLRIEKTLHRWAERECNGEVEVDEKTGKAECVVVSSRAVVPLRYDIPNREAGALRRLAAIMARYPKLGSYHQTDPRGCALYIYEKARLRSETQHRDTHEGYADVSVDIASCYSSVGVAMAV